MEEMVLEIKGMDCADEAVLVEKQMASLKGVASFDIDLVNSRLRVRHDSGLLSREDVIKKIGEAGLEATSPDPGGKRDANTRQGLVPVMVSGAFILSALAFSVDGEGLISIFFYCAAIISGGLFIARKGFRALLRLSMDMNFLMTVAVMGAVLIGEWLEAASITFLFALAQHLETLSMDRARRAVRSLMELSPTEARALRDGSEVMLPVDEVAVGETIIIHPGEKIPLDGKVAHGTSEINQAPITGESAPILKKEDDPVFAGTINGTGALEVTVTRLTKDTTLARIIRMVEEAQCKKAPSQTFVERFARIYTPAVICLALMFCVLPPILFGESFEIWFYRSLVLLVISCPCALVMSTPVAIVSGITRAAREGILIKGGKYLEAVGHLKGIAFDKTGTLTVGAPGVSDIKPLNNSSREKILEIAASLESRSEHHLAKAILNKAREENIPIKRCENFESYPGNGAGATIGGTPYVIGKPQFFRERGISLTDTNPVIVELEREAKTVMALSEGEKIIGLIAVTDTIREESREALIGLRDLGVKRQVMLTGDNRETARTIAERVGIKEFQWELMPEDKVKAVETMAAKLGHIAMVGDGVNDAPALAASTVGIAMGTAGTDVALETADIALMSDDLTRLPILVGLGRKTLSIIKANVAFALGIKSVFIVLAFLGKATLWMAVGADMGASLLVIFNGLRVLR